MLPLWEKSVAEFCSGSWWLVSTIPRPLAWNDAGRVLYSGQSKPREALFTSLHLRVRYPESSGHAPSLDGEFGARSQLPFPRVGL